MNEATLRIGVIAPPWVALPPPLYGGTEALVNPIRWPEPFGLVMIEALAAGTPVLAFPEGAAPEIVDHGRTGFLCGDEADMVRRLADVHTIDRAACRWAAQEHFSTRRMVDDHIGLYGHMVAPQRELIGLRDDALAIGGGVPAKTTGSHDTI